MKCPVCTQAVADNAPFCPFCGKVFDEVRTEQERTTMATGDGPVARDPVARANQEADRALTFAIIGLFFPPLLIRAFILARRSLATLETFGRPAPRFGTIALWMSGIAMVLWVLGLTQAVRMVYLVGHLD